MTMPEENQTPQDPAQDAALDPAQDALPRLVVMISGSGSNLQAIMDAIEAGHIKAQIALVVANRKDAYGLTRAGQAGIPTLYFPLKPYKEAGKSRADYDRDLAQKILEYAPDLIVMAGWMHIVDAVFLDHFPDRVINLHPALPGQFAGTHAIERTFQAFQDGETSYGGCMVHYVIPEVDAGPVIVQAIVKISIADTLESFERKLHAVEHQIIVQAVSIALMQQKVKS